MSLFDALGFPLIALAGVIALAAVPFVIARDVRRWLEERRFARAFAERVLIERVTPRSDAPMSAAHLLVADLVSKERLSPIRARQAVLVLAMDLDIPVNFLRLSDPLAMLEATRGTAMRTTLLLTHAFDDHGRTNVTVEDLVLAFGAPDFPSEACERLHVYASENSAEEIERAIRR